MTPSRTLMAATLAALLAAGAAPALAQVKIGATLSTTGPQASLGIPERNTISLLPTEIGGVKVEYVVLDDASDTTRAVSNSHKLISENKVDLIVGSSTTPNTMAMLDTVASGTTPVITLASSARLIEPVDDKRRWVFKTPHSDSLMAEGIARHAAANGVKKLAFIGFNNALGETFWVEIEKAAKKHGIEVVGKEAFAPTDTSAVAQTLKVIGAAPDAVVVGASGTPAAMPARALRERGYKGKIYFNHGVANNDFLRVCGDACEGAWVPVGPVMVADLLPDTNPVKSTAQAFAKKYEAANGAGTVSLFAAYTWDVGLLLQQAVPVALKTAKPGTPEFRAALRDALENVKNLPTATGVVNMSPTDHNGLDERALVMATVASGKWRLQK
ncbi:ABC transporter substrate-binding protein [Achromobacter xylosoxidans]|nr:ABC transporter substrate-binding protein [Achromobacter xylosoxidans]